MATAKVGIVTAMATEVWPLVRGWRTSVAEYGGREFKFFAHVNAVVLCGGIGHKAGRRAAEAMIALHQPALLIAAGLAGGLRPEWTLGRTMTAAKVIDQASGRAFATVFGEGTVVSSRTIAGAALKQELASQFAADLVDMEGAAVGEVAHRLGVPFLAAKAVSDELNFDLPPLQRFVDEEGRFQGARFTTYAAVRPKLWPMVWHLKRNSDLAAEALAGLLRDLIARPQEQWLSGVQRVGEIGSVGN
jgi:adenosylhomocysteine nucleosidase